MGIGGNMSVGVVDRHIDGDGATDRFDPVDELEQFFVCVVAILIGNGRVERQVNRQQAMPLHVLNELGFRQVVLGCLVGFTQFSVGGYEDAFAGRPDKVGTDLAIFQQVDFPGVIVFDWASGVEVSAGRAKLGAAECDYGIGIAGATGGHFLFPGGVVLLAATVKPPAITVFAHLQRVGTNERVVAISIALATQAEDALDVRVRSRMRSGCVNDQTFAFLVQFSANLRYQVSLGRISGLQRVEVLAVTREETGPLAQREDDPICLSLFDLLNVRVDIKPIDDAVEVRGFLCQRVSLWSNEVVGHDAKLGLGHPRCSIRCPVGLDRLDGWRRKDGQCTGQAYQDRQRDASGMVIGGHGETLPVVECGVGRAGVMRASDRRRIAV